ncbi:hypothetical protein J2TS4_38120 [Paenibacillus sp. J2TS4]|nr:hypothetical protein J2TS4_38120 [Paenibacillus sp. J2TS4]
MSFDKAHTDWIQSHLNRRSGERKGRLERGHQHGEQLFLKNVWWPLLGHFEHLHPEYEVLDWRGRSYFADFVWLPGHIKIAWEIKGYGPHVRDMDRKRYSEELNRETFFQAMGFRVVSFAYDDIAHQPELCITLMRLLLSRYQPVETPAKLTSLACKEIILLSFQLARAIRPKDVEEHLAVNHRTAVRYLHSLCVQGWLRPITSERGHKIKYELVKTNLDDVGWW